jgi:hypothetical protein
VRHELPSRLHSPVKVRSEHTRPYYMTHAVMSEWDRVAAWHNRRHEFSEGSYYSWLEAMWTVAENPPSLDRLWDELANEYANG